MASEINGMGKFIDDNANTLSELYVIYDADGTVVGEMFYSVMKWFGAAHCAACDITHGPHKEKPEFTNFKNQFGVPVFNIHRDEMDMYLRRAVGGQLPCVAARVGGSEEYELLLDAGELEMCNGKVDDLQRCLANKLLERKIVAPNDVALGDVGGTDQVVPTVPQC